MERGLIGSMPLQSQEQNHQINYEQQHDRDFQNQHPPIRLIVIKQLIQIVQGFQLPIDCPMPIAQMKSGRNIFVNSRQVPIAEKFGDVRQFIVEASEVDANLSQFAHHRSAASKLASV